MSLIRGRISHSNGRKLTFAFAVSLAVMLVATSAGALGNVTYDDVPLTQSEIDENWVVDRSVPSAGYGSVSFEGRNDVLEMGVDPDNRNQGSSFYYTEGLIRQTEGATALRADLYLDPDWDGKQIRAGLWGVGHDGTGNRTAYPIIEWLQDGASAQWRVWDNGQWLSHPATTEYGQWSTLEIILDADTDEFVMKVDGMSKRLPALGSVSLGEVIVNMYNYGPGTTAYEMHVSNFGIGVVLASPVDKDDCRNGGYSEFGYANQGLCIASVVSGR